MQTARNFKHSDSLEVHVNGDVKSEHANCAGLLTYIPRPWFAVSHGNTCSLQTLSLLKSFAGCVIVSIGFLRRDPHLVPFAGAGVEFKAIMIDLGNNCCSSATL